MKILSDEGIADLKKFKAELQTLLSEEKNVNPYTKVIVETTCQVIDLTVNHNEIAYWMITKNQIAYDALLVKIVRINEDFTPDVFDELSYQYVALFLKYLNMIEGSPKQLSFFIRAVLSRISFMAPLEDYKTNLNFKMRLYEIIRKQKINAEERTAFEDRLDQLVKNIGLRISALSEAKEEQAAKFDVLQHEYQDGFKKFLHDLSTFPVLHFVEDEKKPFKFPGATHFHSESLALFLWHETRLNALITSLGHSYRLHACYDYCQSLFSEDEQKKQTDALLERVKQFEKSLSDYAKGDHLKGHGFFAKMRGSVKKVSPLKIFIKDKLVERINSIISQVEDPPQPVWQQALKIFLEMKNANEGNKMNFIHSYIPPGELAKTLEKNALEFLTFAITLASQKNQPMLKKMLQGYEKNNSISHDPPAQERVSSVRLG